ncbi:MAG: hypothetical protein K5751_00445 [Treponemataceae bacterium]|nr:hypothetical protein [Treponemataceae bacterium]
MDKITSLYDWFDLNRDSLIKDHMGELVLVAGNENLGYFKEQKLAAKYAKQKGLKVREFLAQYCIPREQENNMFQNVNVEFCHA